MIILGCGLGGCFALLMIVALDHLPDPAQAGALTALMQGGGFLIAATPAWLVALLHDMTGSYKVGWMGHVATVLVVAILVWRFAPGRYAVAMRAPAVTRTQQDMLLPAAPRDANPRYALNHQSLVRLRYSTGCQLKWVFASERTWPMPGNGKWGAAISWRLSAKSENAFFLTDIASSGFRS